MHTHPRCHAFTWHAHLPPPLLLPLQMEQNKKREAELQRMKRDLEEQQLQHEQQLQAAKKKSQDLQNELNDQLDQLTKVKSKSVNNVLT